MRFFSSLVRPDESTGAVMRWVHRIWVFFWLTVLGAGIGLLSLYLTAHSYASIDATALLQSYFKIPLLVAMNLLAPILLVYLGFFLFARPWAAYLLSALPFFTLALASYYKVQLRGDPVLATDLRNPPFAQRDGQQTIWILPAKYIPLPLHRRIIHPDCRHTRQLLGLEQRIHFQPACLSGSDSGIQ